MVLRTGKLPPELRKASLETGIAQKLCPLTDYFGGTWAEDGTIYLTGEMNAGIWRIDDAGGAAFADAGAQADSRATAIKGGILGDTIENDGTTLSVANSEIQASSFSFSCSFMSSSRQRFSFSFRPHSAS